jgi:hypothetical protein
MNETGCCASCGVPEIREAEARGARNRDCQTDDLKFKRKVAA